METFHKCSINYFAWRSGACLDYWSLGRKSGVYSGNWSALFFAYSVKKM